mmetsp:Transcript_9631/g.19671  ORF Transcript_9631/g.19671 Transcript_9631/m.19671 type:complete len:103 (+) Transcript_9631:487-795(+)
MIKSGSLAKARAMVTRCCSPPESIAGFAFALPAMPSWFNSSSARLRMPCLPNRSPFGPPIAINIGSSTFSTTVKDSSKLNAWKTNPTFRSRMRASNSSSRPR